MPRVRPCRCGPSLLCLLLAQPIIGIHLQRLIPQQYFFPPLSLDRGPWVKHRGECSITTRSDPIKYRFNQPRSRRVNTKCYGARGAQRPVGRWANLIGSDLPIQQYQCLHKGSGLPFNKMAASADSCCLSSVARECRLFVGLSTCGCVDPKHLPPAKDSSPPPPFGPPKWLQLLIAETFSSAQEVVL